MRTRDILLIRIADHLRDAGISERQFGMAVTGDHKWVSRLKSGKVSLRSIERAEEIIETDMASERNHESAPA